MAEEQKEATSQIFFYTLYASVFMRRDLAKRHSETLRAVSARANLESRRERARADKIEPSSDFITGLNRAEGEGGHGYSHNPPSVNAAINDV